MKRFLAMAALMIGILAAATAVKAQSPYPSRSIKMICGFPAGSSLDVITRIYAEKLEKTLGQSGVANSCADVANSCADNAFAVPSWRHSLRMDFASKIRRFPNVRPHIAQTNRNRS